MNKEIEIEVGIDNKRVVVKKELFDSYQQYLQFCITCADIGLDVIACGNIGNLNLGKALEEFNKCMMKADT